MSHFLPCSRILTGLLALLCPVLALSQSSAGGLTQSQETHKFRAFLDEDWKRWMQDYPEFATVVGFPGQNRRWTDDSAPGFEARVTRMPEVGRPGQYFVNTYQSESPAEVGDASALPA
jgi:hypothetical protein